MADLLQIIRSVPCRLDSKIIFQIELDEGVEEIDNNFRGVRWCVDD
jgi:hypothetical protein